MIRCDHRFILFSIARTSTRSSMSVRYKSYYGEAEYSGMYGDYVIEPLGDYSVPSGWPMKPYKRPYGGTPGPPVMYEKPSDIQHILLAILKEESMKLLPLGVLSIE